MPELNEQTRMKIESKSDRIRVRQLVTIDSSFVRENLGELAASADLSRYVL